MSSNFYRVRFPSLELNWLPNSHRKTVSDPIVVYSEGRLTCHYCTVKRGSRYVIPDLDIDCGPRSVIRIGNRDSDLIGGAIAHEYRHHKQYERGAQFAPLGFDARCDPATYRQRIVDYFHRQWWERDALLYQHRVSPDWVSTLWMEWTGFARGAA